jgi:hypothetical protein
MCHVQDDYRSADLDDSLDSTRSIDVTKARQKRRLA